MPRYFSLNPLNLVGNLTLFMRRLPALIDRIDWFYSGGKECDKLLAT